MNLKFTEEENQFRKEVRKFLEENFPPHLLQATLSNKEITAEQYLEWHGILAKKGWIAPGWPVEYGGTGWTKTQLYIWKEENARANTIEVIPFGVNMVGPIIYTFGTDEQKKRFLPSILSGKDWWCQGYSEPEAGSDLANLKTTAVKDGDHYIVNGQKTWTTLAQYANWGFFLVRTDPDAKPQEGISFLLIDMKSPGVTVKPIITLGGEHEINEVWLEDVRVPVKNLVHEENKGWTCAKFLLALERSGIAGVARSKQRIAWLKEVAGKENDGCDGILIDDPDFARKIAKLEVDLLALEYTELRVLAAESADRNPGPESSLLKIIGSEIQQEITELTLEAAGNYGAPYYRGFPRDGDNTYPIGPTFAYTAAPRYFNTRKTTIYGGSNEIQRNIIAKKILNL